MLSGISFLAVFSTIVFLAGATAGTLGLFVVSIHRTKRTSLYVASGQRHGAIARSVLVTTRTDRRGDA